MAPVFIGLSTMAVVVPLLLVMRHKLEQYGYQPDGDLASALVESDTPNSPANQEVNLTTIWAVKQRTFSHVPITGMYPALVIGAIVTHVMPYLSSIGIERSVSSLVALTIPVASVTGHLCSIWLCDRCGKKQLFSIGFTLITAGLLFFAYVTSDTIWLLVPFIITFIFGRELVVTVRISLIRVYFGISCLGKIFGFMIGIVMLGNTSGASLVGWVYDIWQN